MVLSWIFSVALLVKSIVYEKQVRRMNKLYYQRNILYTIYSFKPSNPRFLEKINGVHLYNQVKYAIYI